MDISHILKHFSYKGKIEKSIRLGKGHIHDTYRLKNQFPGRPDYVLQKINHHVFRNVDGLMQNMHKVTRHIYQNGMQYQGDGSAGKYILLIHTNDHKLFYGDDRKGYWRMMNYISDHDVYDTTPTLEIAFEGAKKFGEYIASLSALPPNALVETIPDFHNVKTRFKAFAEALKKDPKNRAKFARQEIAYLQSQFERMSFIQNLKEKREIPIRITHNDTKINNILFDKNNKGTCVVDLDTTMPGVVHFDFGDGIRTCANTGAEDDEDLKNVTLDLKMFEAFSAGFIEALQPLLIENERKTLVHAAPLFPYLMGLRFLTDYINGDIYYKTEYADHNLVRARAQLKLALDAQIKQAEMKQILKRILSTSSN